MKKNKVKPTKKITEDINYKIKDLSIDKIIPNIIDNYLITIFENHHTIFLPPHITGVQFKQWAQGRGGIYSKDVLNHALNKPTGKYVLIKGEELYCIARLIEEEEKTLFETFKLIDGKIKDTPYMILRNLKNGDKLTNIKKYIEEKDIISEIDIQTIIPVSPKETHEDESDTYRVESISLFTE